MSNISLSEPPRKRSDEPTPITLLDKFRFVLRMAGDTRLNEADLRCCIIIVDHFNVKYGEAWPSYQTLVKATGMSRATVARAVCRLDKLAVIPKSGGHTGRSNRYFPAFRVDQLASDRAGEPLEVDAGGANTPSHQRDSGSLNCETTPVPTVRPYPSTTPRSIKRRGGSSNPSGPPALTAPAVGVLPPVEKKPTGQQRVATLPDGFEAFWNGYPKKEGRSSALRAYRAAVARGVNPALLAAKAEQYAVAKAGVDPRWCKMPANWLQDECWLEDPQPPKPKTSRATAKGKVSRGSKKPTGQQRATSGNAKRLSAEVQRAPARGQGSSAKAGGEGRRRAPGKQVIRIAGTAWHHAWGELSVHRNGAAACVDAWTTAGEKVRVRKGELQHCEWTRADLFLDGAGSAKVVPIVTKRALTPPAKMAPVPPTPELVLPAVRPASVEMASETRATVPDVYKDALGILD